MAQKKGQPKKISRLAKMTELAKKFNSDKIDHGYLKYYSKCLPMKPPAKLLEVGVKKGAGVKMFNALFPDCVVHGFDLFSEFNPVEELNNMGIRCYKGNCHDTNSLYQLIDVYDIISLDASHHPAYEQITFYHLFINNMHPRSLFVWEDLHTSKDPFYWGNAIHGFEDTALYLLQQIEKGNPQPTKHLWKHDLDILVEHIDDIKIFDEKIAFIWRK